MSDAVQTRRSSAALHARHSCSLASFLLTPRARRPNPKFSNREPLRLENIATHTKQKLGPISNREKEPVFYSGFYSPAAASARQKGEQKANREPLRLETIVTQTKQTLALRSNREKEALFYPHFCCQNAAPPIQKGEQKANRESLRLETIATRTKQNPAPISNREKEALFQPAILHPPGAVPHPPKTPDGLEKLKIPPPIFVSIKNHPDPLFCWSYV
jgi:hypothetical protein